MSRLPDDKWKNQLIYKNAFNSNLISGMQQNLTLYSPDFDVKLYNFLDTKPIENLSFNDINRELDDRDNYFQKGTNLINGIVQGLNNVTDGTEKNIKNMFSNISNDIKLIFGAFILFILLNKR